jgi:transcriptional regulator with XRE-family HTH domain
MSTILHSQEENGDSARPDVLAHVGNNLRRMRQEKELSQSALADISGISRRMIVGLESGEANISLSSLDRLAAALDVSFSEMVRSPDAPDNRRIGMLTWAGEHPDSHATLLGTTPAAREAELWIWSLGEGERYPAEADAGHWHEMLFVIEGTLQVETADGTHIVEPGDYLIFSSALPYVFANGSAERARFVRNVVF